MSTNDLRHHVRYNSWATQRVLESVRALTSEQYSRGLGNSYGGVEGTLIHIYQADQIWFARLEGRPTGSLAAFQPPAGRDAFERDWLALLGRMIAWAEGLSDTDWDRVVAYRNTKGEALETPARWIILHLINHNSYHRGQITTLLRQLGHTPVGTDLLYYYRDLAAGRMA
ncbi:MAG TPA: DinB family protein [Bryobacterales bacterium]|nr:DinB family protein [Bryobacterales bacterium]